MSYKWYLVYLACLVATACDGGSGGGGNSPSTISGVAAAGSALSGTVTLKDSSIPAKELSKNLAADGSFSFDLSGLTSPYLLRASGTANGKAWTLFSFASSSGNANINPLSNLAMSLAYGSDNLQNLYDVPHFTKTIVVKDNLSNAISTVQKALRPTLIKFGVEKTNFISDQYSANHSGLDLIFDQSIILTEHSLVTLIDKTFDGRIQTTLANLRTGTYDFIANPVTENGTFCLLPNTAFVYANETKQFTAFEVSSNDQSVIWSVVEENGGIISTQGLYTAPATAGLYHVKATSVSNPAKSVTAFVTVTARPNVISVEQTGTGEYTVTGSNLVNVGGIEIEIYYNAGAIKPTSVSQGELFPHATLFRNTSFTPNIIKIVIIAMQPITGSGSLAKIYFAPIGDGPASVAIMTNIVVTAPAPTPPGSVSTLLGDVFEDGDVRFNDAIMTLRSISGLQSLTPGQIIACDVSGNDLTKYPPVPDGVCDIYDTVMIFNKAYGQVVF